ALYTASEPASVALLTSSSVISREIEPGRTLERLVPLADELLCGAGILPGGLDGVALAEGPGSFTGLRIGAGTALGLARGGGAALFAAGTLHVWAAAALAQVAAAAAGARSVPGPDGEAAEGSAQAGAAGALWVVLDARRGELYAAAFRQAARDGSPRPRLVEGPLALPLGEASARLASAGVVVGDGRPMLVRAGMDSALPGFERPDAPLALALVRLAAAEPATYRRDAATFFLEYLRQPQAVGRRSAAAVSAVGGSAAGAGSAATEGRVDANG
ncbi:MAG: tRNA (adenosine(37)-N6)-threonylcarbamoyltransferase complex dimerization subunit type 1 TsaB, partial [Gemmatimonadota bacterium]